MVLVDANIVLRYILNDIKEQAIKSKEILEKEKVELPFEVVAEIVYVLEKVYNIKREEIQENIVDMTEYPNIQTNDKSVLKFALKEYTKSKLDFIDAILLGYNNVHGRKIYTFDKKIIKLLKK